MRDLCPNCNAELTENLDCQQCGFGALLTSDDEPEVSEEALPVDAELGIDSEEEDSLSADEIADALESVISEGQEQTVAPSVVSAPTTAEAGSHIDFVT